ncbi:Alcohol dehydrogenase GroES domain protein [Caldicellulosiruptor obsidiansis OB47]|uniref:Alcohol dehydrogenase GroES domain protein n=1 Tax=Caldicellulosiruptor obsidiansis (strain ATCC BAA-2073 / JCM 16842 / OB47) TaxID=608506 RepID=D9TGC9_CALOO|nr:alcohol dehydrogenase catalytic domain-containing protein [Caldicellulosiruptor obsidiansis]ADL43249.1 Alcohol dehydrogenase GroES domain protein [Caldicellulosiruptor obsidiansis OB47]
MKAVVFDANVAKYIRTLLLGKISKKFFYNRFSCIQLKDIPEPELPSENYVKIKTTYAGICGSDLNLIFLHDSPSTSPFASFPFVIGHENIGVIVEKGKAVSEFEIGDRVIVDPVLDCDARELPRCPSCQEEEFSTCLNITEGKLSPGTIMGACSTTGGSWGEYFVAHRSQVIKVPDTVKDQEAILVDPLASALHPVVRNFPKNSEKILVYGAGIIGLLVVWSLRKLGSNADITVIAKYDFQADLALEFGANRVVKPREGYLDDLAKVVQAKVFRPMIGDKVLLGGFDKVFDCVGSKKTIRDGMWLTKQRGSYILVGLASVIEKVDLTPIWFKELNVKGAYCYSTENINEYRMSTYQLALSLIQQHKIPYEKLITHYFKLEDYQKAIEVASSKGSEKSIKVVFKFL